MRAGFCQPFYFATQQLRIHLGLHREAIQGRRSRQDPARVFTLIRGSMLARERVKEPA